MKISIAPADIRSLNESLSRLDAASQWAGVLEKAGLDVNAEKDRIEANRRIATGLLMAVKELEGMPL